MNPDWVSIPNNPCLHERLDWGIKDRGKSKSYSGLKIILDLCTDPLIVSAILALIHLSTWIKLSVLQKNFISVIMNVDFIQMKSWQEWNLDQSLHESDSTFRSGRAFDPEWKMEWTQSRMSCNSILIHVYKYNPIPYVFNRNGMSSIRIVTQSGFI